jgi:hypothetical protein
MRSNVQLFDSAETRFQAAVRRAPKLSATIRKTEYGLLIELSNGRMCSMAGDVCRPEGSAMTIALQWARRNGASSVEILD